MPKCLFITKTKIQLCSNRNISYGKHTNQWKVPHLSVFLFYKRGSEQEFIDHLYDHPDVVLLASYALEFNMRICSRCLCTLASWCSQLKDILALSPKVSSYIYICNCVQGKLYRGFVLSIFMINSYEVKNIGKKTYQKVFIVLFWGDSMW